uniref:Uncharacterized protein n=1 Tax=Arundo donax TaxID=35708 RepID=A0A0A8Y1Z2_ARUDO
MVKGNIISSYHNSLRDAIELCKWDYKCLANAELDECNIIAGVLEETVMLKI